MPPKRRSQKDIFSIIIETESIKATQPKETKSAAATPFKKTESIHNVPPHNTENHQPLYLKKILTQKVNKNQKGFNNQIKAWQSQRDYKKLNNKIYSKRSVKNLKVLKDLLKAKWLKEI